MSFVSFAQNAEDLMLWRSLRSVQRGFWIDVGAADPDEMSVTRAFHDRGWTGVNVEPSEHYFERLRAARPAEINLRVALGAQSGSRPFYVIDGTGLSTLDQDLAQSHQRAGFKVETSTVEVWTLAELCRWHAPADIHFLKIDVEGAEAEVLAGADFTRHRPWIVLVEATSPRTDQPTQAEWEPALLDQGYVFVWFDGLNRFYVARERQSELAPALSLPPNHVDDWMTAADRDRRRRVGELEAALGQARRSEARAAAELQRQRTDISAALAARDQAAQGLQSATTDAAWLRQSLEALRQPAAEIIPLPPSPPPPPALPAPTVSLPRRGIAAGALRPLWRLIRPLGRPAAVHLRSFLTAELRADLKRVLGEQAAEQPVDFDQHKGSSAERLSLPAPPDGERAMIRPPRRSVHQFHPSVTSGDAVTNSLLVTRRLLRSLGWDSEIYTENRDEALSQAVRLIDDLPLHDDYVLMVHHSFGHPDAERIASLAAPKVLIYHNITPAALLDHPALKAMSVLGREQLAFWRTRVAAAIGVSVFNALELQRERFPVVRACQLLFDVEDLRARADRAIEPSAGAPLTILFVGRIVPSKGQADLVDAYAAFRTAYGPRSSRLVLVGRVFGGAEAYEAEIRRRIAKHHLGESVLMTGSVDDDALHDWFARADIYASMSLHEGFGVPLVEAMAHRLPIAALASGAVASTVGEAGILVQTVAGMTEALLALATDPQRREAVVEPQERRLDGFALARQLPPLIETLAMAGAMRPTASLDRVDIRRGLRLTVAGHVNGSYSLACVNRALISALDRAAPGQVALLPVEREPGAPLQDVPAEDWERLQALTARQRCWIGSQVVISQHYPVWVPEIADVQFRTAYVFWEESLLPEATVETLNRLDAVLAPSRFVAQALLDSGVTVPVRVVGFAPRLDRFARLADRPGRVQDRPFTFLHVSSAFPRKGVDVLLAAFARAFGPGERVRLTIKSFPNPHNEAAGQIADLKARFPGLCEITLIDEDLSPDDLLVLYLGADAMVLPSRGEGFNIPAAEAAAAGVPLIVSAVGGHRDFLGPDEASLIEGHHALSSSHLASDGSIWFEPDVEALMAAMRAVVDDPRSARLRAERARDAVLERLHPGRFAEGVLSTLSELLSTPVGQPPSRVAMLTTWAVRCGVAEYAAMLAGHLPASRASITILADIRSEPRQQPRVLPVWQGGDQFEVDPVARAIAREDPDVLLVQHQPGLFSWDCLASLLSDRRVHDRTVAVTLHNTRSLDALEDAERIRLARAFGHAARVIVHATEDLERLRRWGIDHVTVIAQGAPASPHQPRATRTLLATDAPLIGTYGFLLPPKGFGAMLDALAILRRTWPKATLRMVTALYDQGPSEIEHHRLRALARDIGIADAIDWHTGFLPSETSLALLEGCDLLVLPYRPTPEASSAALRTALASLVPTAVTPLDIFREAGDAVARLPGDTADAIAAGVTSLLQDPDRRRALVDRQKIWLDRRSWSRIAGRTSRMLDALHANRTAFTFPAAR